MRRPEMLQDISFRSMLHGLTIRSPLARGRLKSVECPKLPASYTLITAKDIPGKNFLSPLSPEDSPVPILAAEALSYAGQPVAILLGPDRIKLAEYALLVTVQAEEERPVFSGRNAPPEMILGERHFSPEDIEDTFTRAKTIVSGIYRTGIQEHWCAEPAGAAAEYRGKKRQGENAGEPLFTIHTATQWPFHVRRSVALVLGMDGDRIAVECTRIGLSLDGKIWFPSLVACHAALGAFVTGKPVKILYTREEDFRYSPKRSESEIEIRGALGEGGEILGTKIGATINLGAQGIFTGEILDQTSLGLMGSSRLAGVKLSSRAVQTNIPPQGPFAGFGAAQGFFAMELHISHIADTLRQDPAAWRKNHQPGNTGFLPSGIPVREKSPLNELIDTAAGMSGYYRKWASYELLRQNRRTRGLQERGESLNGGRRGIGIATAWQGNGLLYPGGDRGAYGVELTLEKDGSLEIRTSMVSSGDDFGRIWGNIASEILAIEPEKVKVPAQNTAEGPDSGPGTLSRNITTLTRLVEHCCLAIRKQRFRNPLPITVRRQARPVKAKASGDSYIDSLAGRGLNLASLSRLGWGAAVVEVEIYPASFSPLIRGIWLGIDGGKILSESGARAGLKTAAIQALGWASREKLWYQDGAIPKEGIEGYDIPSPGKIPPIRIEFLRNGGLDPKGIGDLPFNCVPAAYVQAVSQAMDHRFGKIPLLPEDIREAGKLRKEEKPV
ncbi:MAG: molybdopterin-dependent oxidoreductase [Treponema sp.]|jgi:CO/xanthine dehydrogenase Mo-binding subunit|nr:molybdopterin-dependent oxidoreductase [Treponema sp.]